MPLFTGRFDYSVDDKGRISIPSRFRDQLEREQAGGSLFITSVKARCLHVYAAKEYGDFIASLSQSTDEASRDLFLSTTASTEECPLDKQGRVMVPKSLLEKAGIKRDAVVLGAARHVQIWDRATYEAWSVEQAERQKLRPLPVRTPADLL